MSVVTCLDESRFSFLAPRLFARFGSRFRLSFPDVASVRSSLSAPPEYRPSPGPARASLHWLAAFRHSRPRRCCALYACACAASGKRVTGSPRSGLSLLSAPRCRGQLSSTHLEKSLSCAMRSAELMSGTSPTALARACESRRGRVERKAATGKRRAASTSPPPAIAAALARVARVDRAGFAVGLG